MPLLCLNSVCISFCLISLLGECHKICGRSGSCRSSLMVFGLVFMSAVVSWGSAIFDESRPPSMEIHATSDIISSHARENSSCQGPIKVTREACARCHARRVSVGKTKESRPQDAPARSSHTHRQPSGRETGVCWPPWMSARCTGRRSWIPVTKDRAHRAAARSLSPASSASLSRRENLFRPPRLAVDSIFA